LETEEGRINGLTLTLQPQHGFILISAMSLLVSFAGAQLGGILLFVLHQSRSFNGDADGLYYQSQMVLRTGLSIGKTILALLKIGSAWRHCTAKPMQRISKLVVIALIHLVLVNLAALYSSRLADTNGMVLLRTKTCGWIDQRLSNAEFRISAFNVTYAEATLMAERVGLQQSLTYAKACYPHESSNDTAPSCRIYATSRIVSKIDRELSCPFQSDLCLTPAISLDSGKISSNQHLGVNSKPSEQAQLRKKTTCAPIDAARYDQGWVLYQSPFATNASLYRIYSFGESLDGKGEMTDNYTLTYPYDWRQWHTGYRFVALSSYADNRSFSDFIPRPEFHQPDADVTLFFLANNISFAAEVKDPFFRANVSSIISTPAPLEVWNSDAGATAIGCTEQWQFCTSDSCTSLGGLYQARKQVSEKLKPQGITKSTLDLLFQAAWRTRSTWFTLVIGDDILVAKDRILIDDQQFSSVLEPHQWAIEVENLHNASLAVLQRHVVDHVLPPRITLGQGRSLDQLLVPETEESSLNICKRQVVRDATFHSFSVKGLFILLFLSLFVIALNWNIPRIILDLQSHSGKNFYRVVDWTQSDPMAIQRAAMEAQGIGPWKGARNEVPTTAMFGQIFRLNYDREYTDMAWPGNSRKYSASKPLLRESTIELEETTYER
jgi:hypothetical protein